MSLLLVWIRVSVLSHLRNSTLSSLTQRSTFTIFKGLGRHCLVSHTSTNTHSPPHLHIRRCLDGGRSTQTFVSRQFSFLFCPVDISGAEIFFIYLDTVLIEALYLSFNLLLSFMFTLLPPLAVRLLFLFPDIQFLINTRWIPLHQHSYLTLTQFVY